MSNKVYTLKNDNNVEVSFMAHGGRVTGIKVPDAKGEIADVVIGYQTADEALQGDLYFGALCGRYANRVSNASFELDGKTIQLEANDGKNHLHGGIDGYHKKIWNVEEVKIEDAASAYRLTLVSPDGDEKYPGELSISVIYALTNGNEFIIEYTAETSAPTIINLTSHAYFNLSGAGTGNIHDHKLEVFAEKYTPLSAAIGTTSGAIDPVVGTPFDFTSPKPIGEAIKSDDEQIKLGGGGLDHNFVLNNPAGTVGLAARLSDPKSGRVMEVYTDQPGVQVYTGNHFDSSDTGKLGNKIEIQAGVALETQIFPDSPNKANFSNAILRPGEEYKHTCIYKFV